MDLATYQQHRFMELMGAVGVASVNLLSGMGESLGLLNVQLAELRATNAGQLALQQLMLHRDELQQHLEEPIYQRQKMVEAFASRSDSTPAIEKALLLRSFYLCVTKAGIGTVWGNGLTSFLQSFPVAKKCVRPVNGVLDWHGGMPSERRALPCPQENRVIVGRNSSGGSGWSAGNAAG